MLRQVECVTEHHAFPFASGKRHQRGPDIDDGRYIGVDAVGLGHVAEHPQTAPFAHDPPQPAGCHVRDGTAHVCQGIVHLSHPGPVPPGRGERVGGDVVSRVVIVGQQVGEPRELAMMLFEEDVELRFRAGGPVTIGVVVPFQPECSRSSSDGRRVPGGSMMIEG